LTALDARLPKVRTRRCYLGYLKQMAVYKNTDSTNNYDVTLRSVLRHNFALSALFLPRQCCEMGRVFSGPIIYAPGGLSD